MTNAKVPNGVFAFPATAPKLLAGREADAIVCDDVAGAVMVKFFENGTMAAEGAAVSVML